MFLQELCKFFKDTPLTFGTTNQLNNQKHEKIYNTGSAYSNVGTVTR